jgi:hypothetical protein
VVIAASSVCVAPCTMQSDCGADAGLFCEPIQAGSASGYCIPHSPSHCLSCTADSDCGSLSEVCFQAPGDINAACHIDCSIAGAAACPEDYQCTDETVNGEPRKLCRPKLIPTCLDAIGGYCDRLSIPQACVRVNDAGTCIGQRTCMTVTKRFDKCGASAPQCKTDCTAQDPAGCMESYCSSATNQASNCGGCGKSCPGLSQPFDNVSCQNGSTCTFSCQGEHYDVDGNPGNGCEVQDSPLGNHTQKTALDLGSKPCTDGSSNPNIAQPTIDPHIVSDARVHESPAVDGFDATTGATQDWYHLYETGGACYDDIDINLVVTGSKSPTCYKLTIITNKKTFSASADGTGLANVNAGSGSYSDNSDIWIVVEKTCGTNVSEDVLYSVTGHF